MHAVLGRGVQTVFTGWWKLEVEACSFHTTPRTRPERPTKAWKASWWHQIWRLVFQSKLVGLDHVPFTERVGVDSIHILPQL